MSLKGMGSGSFGQGLVSWQHNPSELSGIIIQILHIFSLEIKQMICIEIFLIKKMKAINPLQKKRVEMIGCPFPYSDRIMVCLHRPRPIMIDDSSTHSH